MCNGKKKCGTCSAKSVSIGQKRSKMAKRSITNTIMANLPNAGYGTLGAVGSTIVGGLISRFLPTLDERIVSAGKGAVGLGLTRTKSMGMKFFGYGMAIASFLELVGPFLVGLVSNITGGGSAGGGTTGAITSGSFGGGGFAGASPRALTLNLNAV